LYEAPNSNFNINIHLGKDDLAFLGLPENSEAELFYKDYEADLWQSIVMTNDGENLIHFNKFGEFALGVRLTNETTPPDILYYNLNSFEEDNYLSVRLNDDSGIDWSSLLVLANNSLVNLERIGFTNEFRILMSEIPNGEVIIYTEVEDIEGNKNIDVLSLDISTNTDEILVNNWLILLAPNPASDIVYVKLDTRGNELLSYTIYDLTGKLVANAELPNNGNGLYSYPINIQSLRPGTYYFCLKINNKQEVAKFVVI